MDHVKDYLEKIKKSKKEKEKKGKRAVSTFSRRGFTELLQTTLNDEGYESISCKMSKEGKLVIDSSYPVKEFREKFLQPILLDCKLDKEDAKAKTSKYVFTKSQVDTLYPIVSDTLYNYISMGKKFNFIPKKDFVASIAMKDQPEGVKEYTNNGKKTKIKHKACKTLIKKSGTPSWLKDKL